MLGNFSIFFSYADFFFKNILLEHYQSVKQSQEKHFVGPDLGPNCLQRLSSDRAVASICDW